MKFIQFLNQHTRKITLTFCTVITFEFLSPAVALALTAGPTAPEATSFEPVDTTDMVNPLTGSLTYNLPLLEVPGPEGGYPLSLSYHAGIQPDVEASWVGLGWTLNPGAINRNVSGLPDDFSDVTFKRRDYWAGGTRKEFGLEVGFASVANVGLVFASDTYQGFGLGANVGVGFKAFGIAKAGLDVGIGPYGGGYVSVSASGGIQVVNGVSAVASINASTNFESVGFGASTSLVSNSGQQLLSVSMNTSSNKPSLSVMGTNSSIYNKNAGRISTSGSGFGFTVPLGLISIGASFKSERYWIDETVAVATNGSLYTPILPTNTPSSHLDNRTYDNYRLLPDRLNIVDNAEDQAMVGGTYPEYDNYSISGQGIGGQIKPFLYQRALNLQNEGSDKAFASPAVSSSLFKAGVGFRFVNDFSNSFDQGFDNIVTQAGSSSGINQIPFSMGGKPDNRIGNELPSSKHIKYFTNDEIKSNSVKAKGFIDVGTSVKGFKRPTGGSLIGSVRAPSVGKQIGGFMVTNESGVTYHYALPVYTYDEFSYNYTLNGGGRFTSTTRSEPYAYTWLLTAVTGPDYVDRNENGLVDDGDWGYWTAMDYGLWTDGYVWRTPGVGKDADLDNNYKMYRFGRKQLYYLNKIRTRTHTAIFEKEVRFDNKGSSPEIYYDKTSTNEGRFDSKSGQSLRLNRIYLVNNADANIVTEISESVNDGRPNDLFANVIDNYDVAKVGRSIIESKAISVIDFGFSYDLSKETPNSYSINKPIQKFGKLTLDGLQIRGKGGVDLLPVTTFSYDLDGASFKGTISSSGQFTTKNPALELGMMIQKADDNSVYYGMITKKTQSGNDYIYTLDNSFNNGVFGTDIDLKVTKNPPYCKDCNDIWGFYKGDIIKSELALNMDLAKRVTPTSAKGVDAWNLRKISSPLGSSIELDYESNEFQKSVFQRDAYISIKSIEKINDYNYRVEITGNRLQFDEKYKIGDYINGLFFGYRMGERYPYKTAYKSWSGNKECFFEGWTSDNKLNIRFTRKLDNFQAGNIYMTNDEVVSCGGGVRIKSVSNKLKDNVIYQTTYGYREADVSTGVNSYLPNTIESGYFQNIEFKDRLEHEYKKDLNKDLDNILKYAREIPGPGVMYGKVRIQTKVIKPNGDSQVEGFTENRYRVLDSNMINRVILQDQGNSNENPDKYNTYNVNLTIADFTANVGDLLGIKYYDADGMLLKEIENHYIIDDIPKGSDWRAAYRNQLKDFNNQGLIVERFAEVRSYHRSGEPPKTNIVMAAREQFPTIMLYSTIKDYVNGSSETSKNLGFDFLNGQANKVLTTDSYGNRFLSETSFAYQQNTEMGSKLINMDYKNMMSQVFSQINYKVDANNKKTGVISGSKTIWSKDVDVLTPAGTVVKQNSTTNGTVWRKKQVELLEIPAQYGATGILPISAFSLTNGYWKLTNVLSLYNVYSRGLEDFDRNNNFSANRYGYKNSKIVAGANFSKYAELAFSGAEDELTSGPAIPGEVSRGGATVSTAAFHSGSKSLSVPARGTAFEYSVPIAKLTPKRTYVASVWVKNTANGKVNLYYDVDGVAVASPISSAQSTKKSGDWTLVNLEIPAVTGTILKVFVKNDGTAASFVDDFRFHPKNTSATAYVYDTFSGELTYILDHLNLFTRFEYDAMGRLVRTYKEQFGRAPYKTNEYQMNYGSTKVVYFNDRLEEIIQKNDCPSGSFGGFVNYIVVAGKYSSAISKSDANSKALNEIKTKGEGYANANGECIPCPKYKVTLSKEGIPNSTLYVNFTDCTGRYYSVDYRDLETDQPDTDSNPYIVFYVCTNLTNKYIDFSVQQGGESIDLRYEVELVGNCN